MHAANIFSQLINYLFTLFMVFSFFFFAIQKFIFT